MWTEWVLIWIEWSEYFCPYKDEKIAYAFKY